MTGALFLLLALPGAGAGAPAPAPRPAPPPVTAAELCRAVTLEWDGRLYPVRFEPAGTYWCGPPRGSDSRAFWTGVWSPRGGGAFGLDETGHQSPGCPGGDPYDPGRLRLTRGKACASGGGACLTGTGWGGAVKLHLWGR